MPQTLTGFFCAGAMYSGRRPSSFFAARSAAAGSAGPADQRSYPPDLIVAATLLRGTSLALRIRDAVLATRTDSAFDLSFAGCSAPPNMGACTSRFPRRISSTRGTLFLLLRRPVSGVVCTSVKNSSASFLASTGPPLSASVRLSAR